MSASRPHAFPHERLRVDKASSHTTGGASHSAGGVGSVRTAAVPRHYEELSDDSRSVSRDSIFGGHAMNVNAPTPSGAVSSTPQANRSPQRQQQQQQAGASTARLLSPMSVTGTPFRTTQGEKINDMILAVPFRENVGAKQHEQSASKGVDTKSADLFDYTTAAFASPLPEHKGAGEGTLLVGATPLPEHNSHYMEALETSADHSVDTSAQQRLHFLTPQRSRAVQSTAVRPNFNDPLLTQQLKEAVKLRAILEQGLIHQDQHHSRIDVVLEEAATRRKLVFMFSFERELQERAERHCDMLDSMMIQYTTTDYVAQTNKALQQRIDIARLELQEVEEAIAAVEQRTAKEMQAAEDELVDCLSKIRTERKMIAQQIQSAEERKLERFVEHQDEFIQSNYQYARVELPAWASAAPPLQGTLEENNALMDVAPASQGNYAKHGGAVASPSVGQYRKDKLIPRDLWISRVLQAEGLEAAGLGLMRGRVLDEGVAGANVTNIQYDSQPAVALTASGGNEASGGSTAGKRNTSPFHGDINVLFPLPPLPNNLEDLQRQAVRFGQQDDLAEMRKKQQSAAFYQTFLSAGKAPSVGRMARQSSSSNAENYDTLRESLHSSSFYRNPTDEDLTSTSSKIITDLSNSLVASAAVLQSVDARLNPR